MSTWLSRLTTMLGGAKSAPTSERRAAPRYKVELSVTALAGTRSLRGRCCDLSQSGMGLYLNAELEIGETVLLQYELGDGSPPKKVPSVVRNRTGNRYGLEFAS